jgi:hypothetical protein
VHRSFPYFSPATSTASRACQRGKSDPIDTAESAARAVASGEAASVPKQRTGIVEAIRILRVAREGAVKSRTAAVNQLKDVITTAPDALLGHFREMSLIAAARACARLRPDPSQLHDPTQATKTALRAIAVRIAQLDIARGEKASPA